MSFIYNTTNKYNYDESQFGITVYHDSDSKNILTEKWNIDYTGTPFDGLKIYLKSSEITIENVKDYEGKYIANYNFNQKFIDGIQEELVVYYRSIDGNIGIKVIYMDKWEKVRFEKNWFKNLLL